MDKAKVDEADMRVRNLEHLVRHANHYGYVCALETGRGSSQHMFKSKSRHNICLCFELYKHGFYDNAT